MFSRKTEAEKEAWRLELNARREAHRTQSREDKTKRQDKKAGKGLLLEGETLLEVFKSGPLSNSLTLTDKRALILSAGTSQLQDSIPYNAITSVGLRSWLDDGDIAIQAGGREYLVYVSEKKDREKAVELLTERTASG